ncbi:MAG: hypothetical protein HQL49_12765 [Gammaproteobacteria bacterium]|nr:hypothetical protein [Gammaproteobacteria bacterium]
MQHFTLKVKQMFHSISRRITMGFYALAFLLLILAAFTLSDLRYLTEHTQQGSIVSTLVEQVMEMRRQEKNYLLYQQKSELTMAMQQTNAIEQLLKRNRSLFLTLVGELAYDQLYKKVGEYRMILTQLQPRLDVEG